MGTSDKHSPDAISIQDVADEFGGGTPHSLSEYYSGGANVPGGTSGDSGLIPSSGAISLSDFYGASAVGPPVSTQFQSELVSSYFGGVREVSTLGQFGNWVTPPPKEVLVNDGEGGDTSAILAMPNGPFATVSRVEFVHNGDLLEPIAYILMAFVRYDAINGNPVNVGTYNAVTWQPFNSVKILGPAINATMTWASFAFANATIGSYEHTYNRLYVLGVPPILGNQTYTMTFS